MCNILVNPFVTQRRDRWKDNRTELPFCFPGRWSTVVDRVWLTEESDDSVVMTVAFFFAHLPDQLGTVHTEVVKRIMFYTVEHCIYVHIAPIKVLYSTEYNWECTVQKYSRINKKVSADHFNGILELHISTCVLAYLLTWLVTHSVLILGGAVQF